MQDQTLLKVTMVQDAITEEEEFITDLQNSSQPLQVVAAGKFVDKAYPLDYAYGLMIGAGKTRCECGKWGDVKELQIDGQPIPCPHVGPDEVLTEA
jgi:hypothetical protein